MINYFEFAIKNLNRRGIRSWLTLLGIVIGVIAVVSLIALGNGLKTAVNSQFGVSSTQVITVQAGGLTGHGAPGTGVTNPLTRDDAKEIEKISVIEYAIPRNIETVKVEYNDIQNIGHAGSVPDDKEEREVAYELLDIEAEHGRLLRDSDKKKVILGNNFYYRDKNGFQREINPGNDILIEGQEFEVVGILEKKGSLILDGLVGVKDSELEEIVGYEDEVDVIAVKVKDKEDMDKAKQEIEELLRDRRDVKKGQEDFSVETPEAALESINEILNGIQIFIVIIASISIFVGAIGIINTMTTSVIERTKEIGIMKAIGAKNEQIFFQFLIESGMLGLIGGIIGCGIGLGLGYLGTYAINNFLGAETKPVIDLFLIAFTLGGSFLIGAISGISPALKAAKQNPVEAIRK